MITKRIFWALMITGMMIISTSTIVAQSEAVESGAARTQDSQGASGDGFLDRLPRTIQLDVACDCRTFAFNRGAVPTNTVRGDGFIVNGKIFPAGTLPAGAATNDPNDPGSIGNWICRGTLTGAADPFAFITQYHLLATGGGLVSEGAATAPEAQAAVVGGIGSFSDARGDLSAVEIGTNSTGCPNLRFSIRLKRK